MISKSMSLLRFLFVAAFFAPITLFGQILNPVKWSQRAEKLDAETFELIFTARMEAGWSIYSQHLGADGPIPTSFTFTKTEGYTREGDVSEKGNRYEGYDPIFEMNVVKFSDEAVFRQKVKLKGPSAVIEGYLEFMTCDDERCLPPMEVDFVFHLVRGEVPADTGGLPDQADDSSGDILLADDGGDGLLNPVTWSARVEASGPRRYKVTFEAAIMDGWAVYSKDNSSEDGPIPTVFDFAETPGVKALGPLLEEGPMRIDEMDPIFEMRVVKFKKAVRYIQDFEVDDPSKVLEGYFEYMTCDDQRCIFPPSTDFRVDFAGLQVSFPAESGVAVGTAGLYPLETIDLDNPVSDCAFSTSIDTREKGLWTIFLLGFIGGLLALLTPCVFPMIPLTVSFFTKGSQNRRKGLINASMYGLFILLVYVLLSIPFHVMDSINPDILNDISTNVWLNIAFFLIFLFFAFSFFGYYEITMPESWTNKVSSAEGVGGMAGIFFMALTLALVSFSCTGPILGSLLAGAMTSDGGAIQLTMGMSGFGLALALPFALFAAFPGWMNSLPRSGGWLNTVKVVLGFLELALAFKFLSNADLVKHWGLLKIEPFLIIWILIALAMAMYLFGFIRFPHDTPGEKISKTRIGLGVLSFVAALYMATGFRYDEVKQSFTPLTLLSGLAPPVGYSWMYPKDCPNNLLCFKNLEDGLRYAREKNKPVMLDFTGHACVNCRKMEEHVWPRQEVDRLLRNEFVLISLYVDEKIDLPEEEQITVESKVTGTRKLKRTGDKWQHFQTEFFNNNSQPFYVLMTPDGQLLNNPVGYTPDVQEYAAFLQCGLDAWRKIE
jgi:thiol:disulfide interchange protein